MIKAAFRSLSGAQTTYVQLEQVGPGHPCTYAVHLQDRTLEAEVEEWSAADGWIRVHGRISRYFVQTDDRVITVWIRGKTYRFELVDQTAQRSSGQFSGSLCREIKAPMPGTVLKIHTQPDRPFTAHQPLIIMESMKMEMALSVPHDGEVESLLCHEGQLVEMGAILATIRVPE